MEFEIRGNMLIDCVNIAEADKTIIIPFGITRIENAAFDNEWNHYIKEIIIPPSVIRIGGWAFCDCNNLKEITIPKSVNYIGEKAFIYCENLEKVTLPVELKGTLDKMLFQGCFNLKEINWI